MSDLFDAHCHATRKMPAPAPASPDTDMNAAPRRLVCGVAPGDWDVVADWARNWPGTLPAFGIHPWETGGLRDGDGGGWEKELESFLLLFPNAWVGEIGLDGAKTARAPMERQRDVFVRQLRLAAAFGRPVNLHCVKAHGELLAALDAEYLSRLPGSAKFLLHSFAGPHTMIGQFAARGAYFSVGSPASRCDTPKVRARAALLPFDRIVLESDAFLAPGADAEEDLLCTLRWLSGVKATDCGALAQTLAGNSRRLFS